MPKVVTVQQGTTVHWINGDSFNSHTSTSNQGFWGSPVLLPNETFDETGTFLNAGAYGYQCTQHPGQMPGTVKVPLIATGTSASGWTLKWSSLTAAPTNRSFDVQIKRPGSTTWQAFRTATVNRKAFFNPTKTGTYSFRSRTNKVPGTKHSDWSPVLTLSIS